MSNSEVLKMPNLSFRSLRSALMATMSCFIPVWIAAPVLCHEFWIEPEKYQVFSDTSLSAELRNGQMFSGARLPYLVDRIDRFEIVQNDLVTPYTGRMGDMPALVVENLHAGLLIALHETTADDIFYDTLEEFSAFGADKGLGNLADLHKARGLPLEGFTEYYSRHTKLLVGVGHSRGHDRAFGLTTEFVALQNPYETPQHSIPIRLLYQGTPRRQAQVEIYERAANGEVIKTLSQTDEAGEITLAVHSGHKYLLNAVVLRPAPPDSPAVWETLWASMVFAVP